MVVKSSRCFTCLILLILTLFLLLPFAPVAGAQGFEEEPSFTLEEEILVEINEVGDAHVTDTIAYDSTWFDEYSYIFEENPNLLSRRYRADTGVGEFENFDVDVDSRDSTITVTFDTPGFAYNMGDSWDIYGYGDYEAYTPVQDQIVLEASWTLNNEFTLFQSMPLDEKQTIDLPDTVEEVNFDKETGTIDYQLPYATKGTGSVLADNKTVFTIVFALLMALSLLLFLYAITRKTAAPIAMAPVATATPVTAEVSPPQAPAAPSETPPPMPEAPVETVTEAQPKPKFCKRCGQPRVKEGAKFCRKCGAPFE